VFSGVDAYGNPLPGVNGYQQQLNVTGVNPSDMSVAVGTIYMIRVTAAVSYKGTEMTRISWLRTW